jgi:hypothetical protein
MHTATGPLPFVIAAVVIGLTGALGVRWAKRHSMGAQLAASALLLALGLTVPISQQPQQRIEEAREDKGQKGSESGDPPDEVETDGS